MGSTHRAHLILSGGGEQLHKAEKDKYENDLNNFLASQGVDNDGRGAALAHFDIGYDEGFHGEAPYYNDEWDQG